jgi:hypothetical protein
MYLKISDEQLRIIRQLLEQHDMNPVAPADSSSPTGSPPLGQRSRLKSVSHLKLVCTTWDAKTFFCLLLSYIYFFGVAGV